MRVSVSPVTAAAAPGQPVVLTVQVTNTSDIISGHAVRVLGVDDSWLLPGTGELSLFPGATGVAVLTLMVPADLPAGRRRIGVQVRELTEPGRTAIVDVDLEVPSEPGASIALDPVTQTGGRTASYAVVVHNTGNTHISSLLAGGDEESKVRFQFTPALVDLAPGERTAVQVRLKASRRLAGSPAVRPFSVRLDEVELPEPQGEARGTLVQKAWLSRGSLSLVGLLAAVTVFAVVITIALSGVVNRSRADRELALQVAQAQDAGTGPGTSVLAGTVRLLTSGTGVGGVTVEAFLADDTTDAVTTAATDAGGAYELEGLGAGSYKIRFRGAGFAELWYPQSLSAGDAQPVQLEAEQSSSGLDVRLGGLPAQLQGAVVGDDVAGATVSLQLPGTTDSSSPDAVSTGAVLRTLTVDASGTFLLDSVPSPSVYELVVAKTGYATEVQRVDLAGGETRKGVNVRLRQGDGLVTGRISSLAGPLGGASVVATSGQTVVQTVSLTQDDVGAFTLRGLPTPASYSIVVSKAGLASQTLVLDLAQGQRLTGVGVTLSGNAGSLSGKVTTTGGSPAAGVSVRVTNGDLTVQTVTQSVGEVGSWQVDGLPVPNTYTVTFSRDDLASQTLSADLDALDQQHRTGVDAVLQSATAVLFGKASVGEVAVVLTSGARTFRVTTATVPEVGVYEIGGLPPGTYAASFERRGAQATSVILQLAAGQRKQLDPVLAEPASMTGVVRSANGPLVGAEVRLYLASAYPQTRLASVVTDGAGRYRFPDLAAPEHYVVEYAYPAGGSALASRTVTLSASQQAVVDLGPKGTP